MNRRPLLEDVDRRVRQSLAAPPAAAASASANSRRFRASRRAQPGHVLFGTLRAGATLEDSGMKRPASAACGFGLVADRRRFLASPTFNPSVVASIGSLKAVVVAPAFRGDHAFL